MKLRNAYYLFIFSLTVVFVGATALMLKFVFEVF